jgi:hypothetical protein
VAFPIFTSLGIWLSRRRPVWAAAFTAMALAQVVLFGLWVDVSRAEMF